MVLLFIEVLAPAFFFLWMAAAAAAVGVIVFAVSTLDWQYQSLFFAVLSVVSIFLFRRYRRAHPTQSDQPPLTAEASSNTWTKRYHWITPLSTAWAKSGLMTPLGAS